MSKVPNSEQQTLLKPERARHLASVYQNPY